MPLDGPVDPNLEHQLPPKNPEDLGGGLFPSEFTANFVQMPVQGKGVLAPFSFKGQYFWIPIYDTDSSRVLLKCSRQIGKSTFIGNRLLANTCLNRFFKSLFVTPTQQQTETFSKDRISAPIQASPRLKVYMRGPDVKNNVLYKRTITDSEITLRYAFLNADRCRGVVAYQINIDEIQDILAEVIPIIEECAFTAPVKLLNYSGTPLSMDNTLSAYWHKRSTKNEWAIPCYCKDSKPHWNILGMKNLGKKHIICDKCGKQIFSNHPEAQWVSTRSNEWLKNPPVEIPFEGYRICQPMSPFLKWPELNTKRETYSVAQFHNEVLGLEYDSADKLLTPTMLKACCSSHVNTLDNARNYIGRTKLYMGIDWEGGGSDEFKRSYTVVSIGGYFSGKFTYIYFKRFYGEEGVYHNLIPTIISLIGQFKISLVGVDYGGGLDKNDGLIRQFGVSRIFRYQYVNAKKIYFDKSLHRFMVNRTEALMAMVNGIRRGDVFSFPSWESCETPFMEDLLALFHEYNDSRRMTVIDKTPGTTDDTMHSMLYCFLASMIENPRPDILTPDKDR